MSQEKTMGEKVLVTGGAGFIGSHLAERLLRDGRKVRVLDDLSTGRRENVDRLAQEFPDRFEFLEGDIRDRRTVATAMEGVGDVLHEAALPSVERSVRDPWTSHEVNVDGTLRLLEAAREAGVRRFVLAGSSSVYGNQPELPKRETMTPSPQSPYALSKLVAEQYTRLFAELYRLPTITLRYFNVFGPRQDPNSPYAAVIPLFLAAISRGEPPTIFGDGEQTRDFTYIENVVEANLAALSCPAPRGEAVNIACGDRISLLRLLELLGDSAGRRVGAKHAPSRLGDVRDSQADITLASRLIGYVPRVSLDEGIRRTVMAFLKGSAS
jgi:nucleoside-diphosphate-sugar epimerase